MRAMINNVGLVKVSDTTMLRSKKMPVSKMTKKINDLKEDGRKNTTGRL
jgi:hypothetical protein